MGLIKNQHGTWYAQRKVPERLQVAVARGLGNGKSKQVFLKKSLGTKELKAANVRAKLVLAGERTDAVPASRKALNAAEIARMAETLFAKM